jgi:hypothetical protein
MAESSHLVPQRDHSLDTVRSLAALARTTTTATNHPLVPVWQVATDGRLACHWDFDTAPLPAPQRGDAPKERLHAAELT